MKTFNMDILQSHLSSAGCLGEEYHHYSLLILRDMNGPTGINCGEVLIAVSMDVSDCNDEVDLAKKIINYCKEKGHDSIAFYEYNEEKDTFRFSTMMVPR